MVYESPHSLHCTAVQEERQRNKDRDGDYDCSSTAANEDMPVEKILEAETAVDHKTELHSASSSAGAVSVYLTSFSRKLQRRSCIAHTRKVIHLVVGRIKLGPLILESENHHSLMWCPCSYALMDILGILWFPLTKNKNMQHFMLVLFFLFLFFKKINSSGL